MSDEIDICPDCIYQQDGACTQEDILDDPKYDPDMMVDECVHFEQK